MAVHRAAMRVLNQFKSIYQNTQAGTSICPSPSGKLHMYLDDWLLNPGTHQEALEQTSWLKSRCRRLGLVFKPREFGYYPTSGCHLSGDRAGHSCRPGKAITQESDQLHCEQSAQWCMEVQRSFAREVQWAVWNLWNSRLVIQKLDVKSDNFT